MSVQRTGIGSPPTAAPAHHDPPQPGGRRVPRRRFLRGGALTALGAAAAVGGLAGASGCGRVSLASDVPGGNLLEQLREKGQVRLGIAGEIPMGYIDDQARLTGQSPTVARTVFQRLGVGTTTAVPTDFGSLIPGLKAGLFDCIAAGMYITPERCQEIAFSDPDYQMPDAFITGRGNPAGLRDYTDIAADDSVVLGVASGGIQISYAESFGVPQSRVRVFPDNLAALDGLLAGRTTVMAATSITLRNLLADGSHPQLEMTEPFFPVIDGVKQWGAGGYGFHPLQTRLRDAFNVELAKLKASGELLRLVRPFGYTEAEMTDLTAEELCAGTAGAGA
ncbi:ectoine/hydroxyectoine ABC transporter substrate-binding protein EhuB [Allostreptomyces psammosilenae]|uniref:Polar amino acid transport system substrate-binding protein n=1 Tax=Allostreptomyces psammosilenae TaxID=1892865 RepID=A0A853A1I1_9ACTN|nr:ectoine/hydroxyectoine ABC transporter substrate-binding protein EhuB [Allostreptomyces psammosilenae]NYI08219.1 polar amino acid transport system substrate-binding protein [Allostreptomyces psammosilenae]